MHNYKITGFLGIVEADFSLEEMGMSEKERRRIKKQAREDQLKYGNIDNTKI